MEKNLHVELSPDKLSENKEEFKRFLSAINSIEEYSSKELKIIDKMEKDFQKIEEKYSSKLPLNFKERITKLKQCISHNQNILNNLIKKYKPPERYYKDINLDDMKNSIIEEGKFIYDVFSLIVRDWSKERRKEREENYNIIIKEILKYFPCSNNKSMKYKFLIPGSGLNRLGYELYKLGYDIEANELLYLNGMFSDYIFNYTKKDELSLYPNIGSFSNIWNEESVFRKYVVPEIDINLKNSKNNGNFNLIIGDFTYLY